MKKIKSQIKNIEGISTICCLDSVYSLMLYLLIEPAPSNNTLYIFGKGISSSIYYKFENYIIVNHPFKRFKVYIYRMYYYFYFKRFFKKYQLNHCPKYGHDFLRWTDFFLTNDSPFYLIEDGLSNYAYPQRQKNKYNSNFKFRKLIDYIPMLNLHYGLSDNVKKIYLTGIKDVPELISYKTEIINFKNLWENKSDSKQNYILDIFSVNQNLLNSLNQSERDTLLLTQCLSEDGLMTELEKIELYKKAIKNYDLNKLIIKVHPREKTNYSLYFESVLIISDPMPVQLLFLLGFEIKRIITYNSSGVYTIPKNIEKIIIKS